MTRPNQEPAQATPEEMSPFDLAVYSADGLLSLDERTKHRDAEGVPITEGLTRSIGFGDCAVQEFTDGEGNVTFRYAMIGGDIPGYFVDLDPQTGEAIAGIGAEGVAPAPEDAKGLPAAEDHDLLLINAAFPVELERAAVAGEIVFPAWEVR